MSLARVPASGMLDSPRGRFGALVVLLAVLAAMLVWYGTLGPAPAQGDYPTQEDYAPDPTPYLGDRVVATGIVVSTDPVRIEVTYGVDGRTEYAVTGLDGTVAEGRGISVFGRLTDPGTIAADRAFTVPQSGLWYAWTISFLAGLWVLARIVRDWRLDRSSPGLVPRERRAGVRGLVGSGGSDDDPGSGDHRGGGGGA